MRSETRRCRFLCLDILVPFLGTITVLLLALLLVLVPTVKIHPSIESREEHPVVDPFWIALHKKPVGYANNEEQVAAMRAEQALALQLRRPPPKTEKRPERPYMSFKTRNSPSEFPSLLERHQNLTRRQNFHGQNGGPDPPDAPGTDKGNFNGQEGGPISGEKSNQNGEKPYRGGKFPGFDEIFPLRLQDFYAHGDFPWTECWLSYPAAELSTYELQRCMPSIFTDEGLDELSGFRQNVSCARRTWYFQTPRWMSPFDCIKRCATCLWAATETRASSAECSMHVEISDCFAGWKKDTNSVHNHPPFFQQLVLGDYYGNGDGPKVEKDYFESFPHIPESELPSNDDLRPLAALEGIVEPPAPYGPGPDPATTGVSYSTPAPIENTPTVSPPDSTRRGRRTTTTTTMLPYTSGTATPVTSSISIIPWPSLSGMSSTTNSPIWSSGAPNGTHTTTSSKDSTESETETLANPPSSISSIAWPSLIGTTSPRIVSTTSLASTGGFPGSGSAVPPYSRSTSPSLAYSLTSTSCTEELSLVTLTASSSSNTADLQASPVSLASQISDGQVQAPPSAPMLNPPSPLPSATEIPDGQVQAPSSDQAVGEQSIPQR